MRQRLPRAAQPRHRPHGHRSTSWSTSSRAIAGKRIGKRYDLTKPQGVRGRNSDNTRLREVLGWEPQINLEEGLARTYRWIHDQLRVAGHALPRR